MSNKKDNVYIYLWEELNTIYIGRTINPKGRHYAHKHRKTESTYKFSKEHGVEHPKMVIIENDLTIEEGIEREKYWIKKYRENTSYNVLNKTKGGEIGTSSNIKWTKEAVFEESKKYSTRNEFKKNSNAYQVALKKKWLDEMPWLMIVGHYVKWTKEVVFEEAKKYHTINEFRKNCNSAYIVARKNKWLKDMYWLEKVLKWTKETVFEESKKYSSRGKFFNGNSVAYRVALKNKWFDEMIWLKKM